MQELTMLLWLPFLLLLELFRRLRSSDTLMASRKDGGELSSDDDYSYKYSKQQFVCVSVFIVFVIHYMPW